MRKLLLAATAAAAIAAPAAAVTTYDFSLTGSYNATWSMPASPTPDTAGDVVSYFNNVAFTLPGNIGAFFTFVIIKNDAGGGIAIEDPLNFDNPLVYRGLGDEIYTGSLAAPTFKTGTFSLSDFDTGTTLTISAVPEPASWAMLIAGFGLTGAAMRRRRVKALTA